MQYFLARVGEPGTLRSLAVVFFALKGIIPDVAVLDSIVNVLILALGTISALMPEKGVKAVEAVQQATETAREATEMAVSAAAEAKATTGRVVSIVEGLKR